MYINACEEYSWVPIPISVNQACLYVTYLAERLKLSTIITYYQAVVFYHVCVGIEPVRLSNPILKSTIRGIERDKQDPSKGKDPIFPEHLLAMGKVVNFSSDLEILVFIAAMLMFRTLLRISHIVESSHTIRVKDVKFEQESVLLYVKSSKTDQSGSDEIVPITTSNEVALCPVRALEFFIAKFKMPSNHQLFSCNSIPVLTYGMFAKCFKKLVVRAGLEGDYASHSLRRGGATFMSMLNCSISEIKTRGMWKSDCVYKYIVPGLDSKRVVDAKVAINC